MFTLYCRAGKKKVFLFLQINNHSLRVLLKMISLFLLHNDRLVLTSKESHASDQQFSSLFK